MCELLAMSFNLPIKPNISFRGFRHRGDSNPHGWGIAFYPDESAQVIKEPIRAGKSPLSKFLQDYQEVKSRIFIGHVRYTRERAKSHKNTHPFCRELNGKEYVFAHNGTLRNYKSLKLGRFKPIGKRDSEHTFCYLLNCIEKRNITKWRNEDFEWLAEKFKEINEYGSFNCIFSDGKLLFCYYDKKGHKGLCFVQRKPPYGKIRLLDEDWQVDLAEEKRPEQTGYIIATRKLTDEPWEKFKFGELIVFKDGKMIYSNSRDISETEDHLTIQEKEILKTLRNSPHRLSLKEIAETLEYPIKEIKSTIHSLLCKGYIHQDSRDSVNRNHKNATFYTEPSKRKEIDRLIK